MKKIISFVILVIFILNITGCATTRGYEALLETWRGAKEEDLIASWGPPQNSYQMGNGQKAIEYSRSQNIQTGGYTYTTPQTTYQQGIIGNTLYSGTSTQYVTQTTPVYNIQMWCKTSFIIGSNGIIQTWRYEGNNCTSRYKPPKDEGADKVDDYYSSHKFVPGKGIPWQEAK